MDTFKVDEYKIFEKGREYSVLVFPKVEHMWAFDDDPEDYRYMVDGSAYAFKLLKLACAILIESPDKIIYFPCKQDGIGRYYSENFHLVLCTPQVQLRRSRWVQIRRKIGKLTWAGKYRLQYNRKKLDDYCEKNLMQWYDNNSATGDRVRKIVVEKKIKQQHIEEVVGDTLFLVMGKEECYYYNYTTGASLDKHRDGNLVGTCSAFGWILSARGLESVKTWAKQEREEEERGSD